MGYAFRSISNSKATGLAAVAGGLAESFVLWGIVVMVVSQVAAIVLLSRSFSRDRLLDAGIAVVSMCLSTLMLSLTCLVVWFAWFQSRR